MMRTLFVILIGISFWRVCPAQQPDTTRSEVREDLERALEDFDPEDPQFDTEQLSQFLQELAANPVNINIAGIDELLQTPGVNLKTGRAILDYRENVKPFESVGELLKVKGIGRATLERMRPYVTVGSGPQLRRALYTNRRYWTHEDRFEAFSRFQQTLQEREGYLRPDSGGYTGNPVKYYQRFRYKSDHFSANLTQEKDAGEPLDGPAGFDYSSWHLALQNIGKLKNLTAGDYSLSFGQGLVLWSGGSFGKGREVIGSIAKNERGIRPYTSSRETNFFRGLAATFGNKIRVSGFYSDRAREATVLNGDTTRFPTENGLHRTLTEISKKQNINQKVYGGRIRTEVPFGFVGATGYRSTFSRYIDHGTAAYDQFDFRGRSASTFGIDYKFLLGPAILFGEGARSENGGYGVVTGVESSVKDNTGLALIYRNYQKDFQSIFGSGFGEQSGEPQNEEGIYLGLRHQLNEKILLSAYFDQYRFPAPRFGTHQPTRGYDWLGLVEVNVNSDFQFYLQGRSEAEDDEFEWVDDQGRIRRKVGKKYRSGLRGHVEYRVNPEIRLRIRGEVVRTRQAGEAAEYGYLMYQDIRFRPSQKWTLDARITVFETESFNSRVFQFENDLLYVFSNSALFDQGQRLYVLVNYEPFDFMEIWAKFGITVFENRQEIGSGLDTIKGNKRSEVGVQVRIKI